jgi:hypothetical protein
MRGAVCLGLLGTLLAAPCLAQPSPPAAPPPAQGGQQRQHDARVDAALRRVLGVLMQQYGELAGKVPQSLNDADIAMRQAVAALQAGDDATAAAAIQKAIEALQKGGQSMSQQLAEQFGAGQGDDEEGDDQAAGDQDGQQPGDEDGNGPGGYRYGNGRDGHGPADRREDARRDPLGRPLRDDGNGPNPDVSGVRLPEQMEQDRARAVQEELRRREAQKSRPPPELDYIERLLKQF